MGFVKKTVLTLIILCGCVPPPPSLDDAVVNAVAPPCDREAPEPQPPFADLCCYGEFCVQPQVGQQQCAPQTTAVQCPEIARLASVGPLWRCR